MIVRNNVALQASDYTAVPVYNPLTGGTVTAYNLSLAKASAVDLLDANDPDFKRSYNSLEINFNARLPRGARIFGGTSTERTITNSCSAAKNDPNLLTFCDPSQNNIPFLTTLKLAGTYPLPWYGLTLSASYQGLAGNLLGTEPLPYGPFTAGEGFDIPNGRSTFLLVTPTTNWTAATCPDASKCTVGQRIIPGLTQAQLNLLLEAPATRYAPRLNQIDFSVGQNFTVGRFRFNPKLDLFNVLNSNDWTAVQTLQFGAAAYQRPSVILQARIIRVGVDVKW